MSTQDEQKQDSRHVENQTLMRYFMEQTNLRLLAIEVSVKELLNFKAEMLAQAKNTSVVVSSVVSIIVGLVIALASHYIK